MEIIKYYTGNIFINNALMTIKALAGVENVSDITTELLHELFLKVRHNIPFSLTKLNINLKNYTILYTRNGPLHNKNKKLGEQIYQRLMLTIIERFENDGNTLCDFSGLKFTTSFSDYYKAVLHEFGLSDAEIAERDTALNRCWFPLIGGLGSDAQSLPMAKYIYNLHPIFVVILQFLPLSSLIYKRGILLVDSIDFRFAEEFVCENLKLALDKIRLFIGTDNFENIKFSKGNYLLHALEIIENLHYDDRYIDFNLWSFSNSGAGASCEIDRISNRFIFKLDSLYRKSRPEVVKILQDMNLASSFIEALDDSVDWNGLYPGKNNEGVSVAFFEAYYDVIDKVQKRDLAKYIAYLIFIYKRDSFEKYLVKTDAYRNPSFKDDLNAILIAATSDGKWTFEHQLSIQDNVETLPVSYGCWSLHKLIHYYYQKKEFSKELPIINKVDTKMAVICRWIISLIENDDRRDSIIKDLTSYQKYQTVSLEELFLRHAEDVRVNMDTIFSILFDENGNPKRLGLLSLLRFYFVQPERNTELPQQIYFELEASLDFKRWFQKLDHFLEDYISYRCTKVKSGEEKLHLEKTIMSIPKDKQNRIWFEDILFRLNGFNKDNGKCEWDEDELLCDPLGNYRIYMVVFYIKLNIMKFILN